MTHYLEVIHRPNVSEGFFEEFEKISGVNLKIYADSIVDYLEKIASPKITLYPGKKMDKTLDLIFGHSFFTPKSERIARKAVGISLGQDLLRPENAQGLKLLEELHPGITGRVKKLGGVVFVPSPAAINEMRYQMARYRGATDEGAKRFRKVEEFLGGSGKEASRDVSAHELKHHERRLKNPEAYDLSNKEIPPLKRLARLTKEEAIAYGTGAMARKGVGGKIRGIGNAPLGMVYSVGMHAPGLIGEAKGNFMKNNPRVRAAMESLQRGHKNMKKAIRRSPVPDLSPMPKQKSVPNPSAAKNTQSFRDRLQANYDAMSGVKQRGGSSLTPGQREAMKTVKDMKLRMSKKRRY